MCAQSSNAACRSSSDEKVNGVKHHYHMPNREPLPKKIAILQFLYLYLLRFCWDNQERADSSNPTPQSHTHRLTPSPSGSNTKTTTSVVPQSKFESWGLLEEKREKNTADSIRVPHTPKRT